MIEVYFDGLCQPKNPGGIACYAFVVKKEGETIHYEYGLAAEPFSKDATNNVAEYTALLKAMEWLLAKGFNRDAIRFLSDSKLVVNQLSREYKVKARRLIPLYRNVLVLKESFKGISIDWIPREKNSEADELTNRAFQQVLTENPRLRKKILFISG